MKRPRHADPRHPGAASPASPESSGPEGASFGRDATYKPSTAPAGPWIYRKMLGFPDATLPHGAYTALRMRDGRLLGHGFLNRKSEIAFRLVAGPDEPAALAALLDLRLAAAASLRTGVLRLPERTDAWRLANAEGDDLSGLVVDRYGPSCVASVYSIGWIAGAETLEAALLRLPGVRRVLFRADERSQKLEGFRLPAIPEGSFETVREGPVKFRVDLAHGHKTGLFLDQRDNRVLVAGLARGRRMLDLCTNAGGFALVAAATGRPASVTGVDLDEVALDQARRNAKLNQLDVAWVHADLFPWLRERVAAGDRFDLVVLDPPKLARTRADVSAALRNYRDMNVLALRALAPGGLLLTCSCSGPVSAEAFVEIVRRSVVEAGRRGRILDVRGPAPDHPVALDFLEGRYLQAVLLHVD